MAKAVRIARRTFLIGTAAVAGGVAVGYYLYKRPYANPLLNFLAEGEAALTPYVRIDSDGVTVITPRADLGQGAYSIQAALVAEELDLAWQDVRVAPGPPSPAYYNGKIAAEGFPIRSTDDGFLARNARALGDVAGKFLGLQITGGSSTVADAFDKLRIAGAVARHLLIEAAAQQTGFAIGKLGTRDGNVVLPDGSLLAYADLATMAAEIDAPDALTLKPRADWRYLGHRLQRLDTPAKTDGSAIFGIDLQMPEMVYATVRSNPRRGGVMHGYDASAAENAPGVLQLVRVNNGVGVIAVDTWHAFQAVEKIVFDWGPAPYPATSDEQWQTVADSFTDERLDSRLRDDGDVEAALESAEVIHAEYRVPYLAHAPLEPMNAVVQLRDGRLDIWTGTQIPLFMIESAAAISGLDTADVHLHVQVSGGSFGRRLEDDYVRQAVLLASAMPGRPIKMTWTREEDMSHDFPRPMGMMRARGAVRDGHVTACDLRIAYPSVTASQTGRLNQAVPGPDVAIVAGAWDQPFAIPNYRVSGYRVPEMVPVSSWRSVGASGNGFLHECFLDELLYAAGAEPLAERIRLCGDTASRKVLEAVGELSGWGQPLQAGRGRGIAFVLSFGVPVAEVVEVTSTSNGIRIDRVFVAVDSGTVLDPDNFEHQVHGGVIWGLGHAMNAELTYADGMPEQSNFHQYTGMRINQAPEITVRALQLSEDVRGIGEPPVPPAAPALANAIFAATGQRIRELPLNRHIDFV